MCSNSNLYLRQQHFVADQVGKYITQGASSVVLSDAIFDKKAMLQRNFSAIYQLSHLAAMRSKEAIERWENFSYITAIVLKQLCYLLATMLSLFFSNRYGVHSHFIFHLSPILSPRSLFSSSLLTSHACYRHSQYSCVLIEIMQLKLTQEKMKLNHCFVD